MKSEEWKEVRLGDIINIEMGQSPKSEYYNSNGNGLPFLQGNRTFGEIYPTYDTYCSDIKKIANKNDVIMSVRAPVGDINISTERICIGRGLCSLSMKNQNNRFLYYLLKYNVKKLMLKETGTVFGSVNKNDICNLKIFYPTLEYEQKAIADTLSCIDDKIENNNRMNKVLEEMAQAIFKSWFIDFEPFKDGEFVDSELGMIPKGWRVGDLLEISNDIVCGKTPPTKKKENFGNDLPFVTIPDMHGHIYITKTERYLSNAGAKTQKSKTLPINSIIVSCIATPGLISINPIECQTNQQINSIICKEEISYLYTYHFLKTITKNIIDLGSGGSTTYNLNKNQFSKIKILIPDINIINNFHIIIYPLFLQILEIELQNNHLTTLRDTLLPKLMSGEIRVPYEENTKEE